MKRIISTCVLAALLFAAGSRISSAAEPQKDAFVIRGTGSGSVSTVNHPEDGWILQLNLTGEATQLGKVTAELTYDWVRLADSGDNLFAGLPTGKGTITTADGDKIFVSISWLSSPTLTEGLLAIAGTVTVTGGTGKYAGATGQALYVGYGYVPTRQIGAQLEGTLVVPRK